MTVKYKQIDAAVGDNGRLEGYLSTWDRVPDSYGDVVKRGAFTGSLERWKASGKHIPLLFSHRMDDLAAYIGTLEADEDDVGLHFIADFDDTEEAQRVRSLYKDGRLSKFSFAYTTLDEGPVTLEDGTKANELRELEIHEGSAVLVPANGFARVTDVKSGRRNSAADEAAIRDAIRALQRVLGELDDPDDPDDGEDDPTGNAAAEDPKASNPRKSELLDYIKKIEKEN